MVERGEALEVFVHETLGRFDISALRAIINASRGRMPVHEARFDLVQMVDGVKCDAWQYLLDHRDIDIERAASLTLEQINEPVILLDCPPDTNGPVTTQLLVDGIHRMYRRKMLRKAFFRYYLIPLDLAPRPHPDAVDELDWGDKHFVNGKLMQR